MIKRAIKLSSFLCAIMVSLLTFQYITISQQRMPLGTTNQFELNFNESNISKEKIISDLNEIVDDNNAILLKTSVDSESYENKKDIIWFGSEKPEPQKLIIDNNNIHWLDSSLEGEMISSLNMDVRPLSRTYSIKGEQRILDELNQWSTENNINISWFKNPTVLEVMFSYLFLNGVGNAVLASFLLLITTIITWLVSHAKSRAIRLLGGVKINKIHTEDKQTIISFVLVGFFLGAFVSLGYVGVLKGIQQIKLVILHTLGILFVVLFLVSCCVTMFSIIASPKPEHIAKREIPLKRFDLLGKINRVAIVILALIVIPTTVTSAVIMHKLSNEHALWDNMQTLVRLSFNDTSSLETETMLPEVESFLKKMYDENNLELSFVVDKAILLDQSEMGRYDHIVVTDRSWIDSFEVGVEEQGKSGKLTSKDLNSLPTALSDFLKEQLPIWTKNEEVQPEGVNFYEYVGKEFLALPPDVGLSGETVQAKNPLVILVDNPIETFKVEGFLLSLTSSGNTVFSDEIKLQSALSGSPIKPYVSSIDGIADNALEMAQNFKQQSVYYVVACVLILIALFFTGVLSGKLWAGMNKKRIFTLHTFGMSYSSIINPVLRRELFTDIATTLAGTILAYLIHHMQLNILLPIALVIVLLYLLGSLFAYQLYTRQTFHLASQRHD